jgi:RNA polymerase sigma factor (TIGR02999 family)
MDSQANNDPGGDVTQLLQAVQAGETGAFDKLVPLVYDELRRIAHRHLLRSKRGQTLNTTALVHEVYVKMSDQNGLALEDRASFLAVSACAMRQVVIQFARSRNAIKRGEGASALPLDQVNIAVDEQAESVLEIDRALTRLRERNAQLAQVVECRFFAGLSVEETAEALGVSLRTAQRLWQRARAWLHDDLSQETED